jgi:hypothetical protein
MAIETTSDLSLVGTSQIVDGSVTSAKIAAAAVGSAALASGAVVAAAISAGAVGSAALADNAVVAAKISAGSVGTVAISSGSATSGQILQANGSGAVTFETPAAGGGLTLIATATPSAATTISFTSIPTTYKHLMIVWQDVFQSSATGSDGWGIRLNNDTSAGLHTYYNRGLTASSTTGDKGSSTLFTSSSAEQRMIIPKTTSGSTTYADQARGVFMVYRYTESNEKFCEWRSSGDDALSFGNGRFGGTSAITQIDFVRASTQTITGKFYLYGVS